MIQAVQSRYHRNELLYNRLNRTFESTSVNYKRPDEVTCSMHNLFAETDRERKNRIQKLKKRGLCPQCGIVQIYKTKCFGLFKSPMKDTGSGKNIVTFGGLCVQCHQSKFAGSNKRKDISINELIHERKWEAIKNFCEISPEYIASRDFRGNTCLHYICMHEDVPFWVTRIILQSCPYLASIRNNEGSLPLHVAVRYHTHLVHFIETLNSYPEAIHVRNAHHYTPIDYLSIKRLFQFMEKEFGCPRIHFRKDIIRESIMLLMTLKVIYDDSKHFSFKLNHEKLSQLESILAFNTIGNFDKAEFWTLVHNFISFSNKVTNASNLDEKSSCDVKKVDAEICEWNELHATLMMSPLRLDVFAIILNSSPDQCLVKNINGQLPLHKACSFQPSVLHSDEIIMKLLRIKPQAASMVDEGGNLPLILALEAGRGWTPTVKVLVDAYPQSLATTDFMGFSPFMICAMSSGYKSESKTLLHLDCIFELLLHFPEACFR